jgi:hypothetical protein
LGTVTAIESALKGVQSPTSSDTIVSTDVLNSATNTTVYIDNGAILEATHTGVAIEAIVNSALGGEKFFQLVTGGTQTSVTKALLQTVASEPFDLNGGEVLAVIVGDITYNHTFASTDFANPGSATAYEVCASINFDTTLNYEAVTAGNGTFVVIRPADELTNVIQITTPASSLVIDANTILQFPSQKEETLRLYKNGILLIEDGTTASIFTQPQSLWSNTIAQGDTLSFSVDGTAPITYTITNAQFIAEGTYTTAAASNSLQAWVNVFNDLLTGITASIVGSTIEFSSNLGPVDRAQITVINTGSNPSSLITKGMINNSDLASTGVASQYTLDRNTAQIELVSALVKGDSLSAGTLITQANIDSGSVPSGSATLATDAHIWIAIDTDAVVIPTIQSGSLLSVSLVSPNIVRFTSNVSSAFSNVIPGDYVIVWSPQVPTTDQLEGRVHAQSGSTLDIKITAAEYALATPVSNATFVQGFVVVRTANVPQKFTVTAGTSTLDVIASELQSQTDELTFGVFDNTNITVVTNTLNTEGQIVVVTADASGALLGFVGGVNSASQTALIAFYETQALTSELPLFFHSTISADNYAEPPYSYLTNFTSSESLSQFDPNEMIQFLNPYGVTPIISGGGGGSLLTASAPFAILAGSAITNTGSSVITGDVGIAPGTSITPGGWTVTGTIHNDDSTAMSAQTDALSVYTTLSAHSSTTISAVLDGQTLTAGYYSTGAASLAASGPGTLTLSGSSTDVFVIKTASTLVTGAGGTPTITLTGGALATNVYWLVGSSATINSGSAGTFQGTILANTSITDTIGGTVNGRLIALNGAVTLSAATTITVPASGPSAGVLTLVNGTGDATISFTAYTVPVQPSQYTFTVNSANATAGAVYSTNGLLFTVTSTIVDGTTLITTGAGLIDDEQPTLENVQMSALSGDVVTILPVYPDVRRLRVADRYFVANPLDFGFNDTVVAIVDNNTVGETYTMPLFRAALINSTYPSNNYSFNAYDVAAGTNANFAANFSTPTDFFANYKALLQAKYVLSGSNSNTSLLYRSAVWGRSGEMINVSYVYPSSANQPISSVVTTNGSVNIAISLISGLPLVTNIAANTQWNVTVTSNTPTAGIDQVTYTWNGTGTNPNLPVGLGSGAFVNISTSTGFNVSNTGTFRISMGVGYTPTTTSFSVQVPTGTAIAQSGAVTTVATGMNFYVSTPTTASAINTYVNANLSQYLTSTIVNGDGSGIISNSTFEDSSFTTQNYSLKDGVNWIFSSNVSGSPQFTFKEPLSYSSAPGYSFFTPGDQVMLIPTTTDQVKDFWNILAVTGFTTVGTVETSDRGTKLQLATNTIGSVGSIQVVGGSGNEYVVPILTSGELIGNNEMVVSANKIASQAVASDQWFRLQAQNFQNKNTGIAANTSVTVLSNTPIAGQSTVTLLNQDLGQRYFGSPRGGLNIEGNTFRIEKQGSLTCLSWNGVGTSPNFSSAVNFNDAGSWVVDVSSNGTYSVSPTSAPPPSPLGTAATYGILAGSAITNSVGTSVINGNLGESPGSTVTGTFTVSGATNLGNAAAATAQSSASSTFTSMQTQGLAGTVIPSALDGQTLTPGAYKFSSGAATLATSGPATLTFNGAGQYIIYTASTLTTGAGGTPTITLTGGATAADIFWIIGSSATINAGNAGTFEGNIVANTSITNTLGGIVNGSLIALNGAVTLSQITTINTVTGPDVANNANFAALTPGDIITITGLANSGNDGTFIVSAVAPNGLSFTVDNPNAVTETGTIVTAGEFTATTSVSEGDTLIISAPFSPLNQGEFRVIRENQNSVWYENPKELEFPLSSDTVEEEVTCVTNPVTGFSYGSSTQFNVEAAGGIETLVWTGVGTAPLLGSVLPGDVVTFGSGFETANQGSFVVTESGPSQQQVVQFTFPSGITFSSSGVADYFELYNGGNANKYYIWYNVAGGSNTDPAPGGFTGIEVAINSSDSAVTVASETYTAINGHLTAMTSSYVAQTNVVTVTATVPAATNSPVDVSMPAAFSFTVTQSGQMTFLTVINPTSVTQSGLSSVTLSVSRPQIQFFPYDATVPGDKLVVNGTVVGAGNAGVYTIVQVLNPTTAIITGTISTQFNTNLAGNFVSFSVQEGTAYTGYKQVLYAAMDPGSLTFNNIAFNTSAQFDKINLSADVGMTALGKLNFPVTIKTGTDAYNYDTGLIGQANRVIYGDPRDAITYSGVNAAGTNIFIREPLLLPVSIALSIRTNIGVSFAQITSQIQSSVYALILSNPLGQSLDLSSIVETVRAIPGVTSVVLTSPAYTVANDEIKLVTGQKAFVINQQSNIVVTLIGS